MSRANITFFSLTLRVVFVHCRASLNICVKKTNVLVSLRYASHY
jgi:hypothetical protein